MLIDIAVSYFVVSNLLHAKQQANLSSAVARLVNLDKSLFELLVAFRIERGDSASALRVAPDAASSAIASVKTSREKVDAMAASLASGAEEITKADIATPLQTVQMRYVRLLELRQTIDANLVMPLAQRQSGLDADVLSFGAEFLTEVETASNRLENEIQSLDETMTPLLQIRYNV